MRRPMLPAALWLIAAWAQAQTMPSEPPSIARQPVVGDLAQAKQYLSELAQMVDASSAHEKLRQDASDIVSAARARVAIAEGNVAEARRQLILIRSPHARSQAGLAICREVGAYDLELALQLAPSLLSLSNRMEILIPMASNAVDDGDTARLTRVVEAIPPLVGARSEIVRELVVLHARLGQLDTAREVAKKNRMGSLEATITRVDEHTRQMFDPESVRKLLKDADAERKREIGVDFYRLRPAMEKRLSDEQLLALAEAGREVYGLRMLWLLHERQVKHKKFESARVTAKIAETWARESDPDERQDALAAVAGMYREAGDRESAWRCLLDANGVPSREKLVLPARGRDEAVRLLVGEHQDAKASEILGMDIDPDDFKRWIEDAGLRKDLTRIGRSDLLWNAAKSQDDSWKRFIRHASIVEGMLRFSR